MILLQVSGIATRYTSMSVFVRFYSHLFFFFFFFFFDFSLSEHFNLFRADNNYDRMANQLRQMFNCKVLIRIKKNIKQKKSKQLLVAKGDYIPHVLSSCIHTTIQMHFYRIPCRHFLISFHFFKFQIQIKLTTFFVIIIIQLVERKFFLTVIFQR